MPVFDDALVREDVRELIRHGEMGGVAPAGQQAGIVQHRRRGTDRGEPAARGMLAQHQRAHAGITPQRFDARPAGQKRAVEFPRARGLDGGERRVRMQREPAAAGDMDAFAEGCDRHLGSGPAQKIDGRHRLNFLKTIREDCENRGHGVS